MTACQRLVFLILTGVSSSALAWGWEGHRLVCGLAEQHLTDRAAAMVETLLEEGQALKGGKVTFTDACLWPDDVKHSTRKSTYEHHFINVPDDATTVDLARDCAALNCTATAVQQALTYLSAPVDGDRARQRRAAALRFLGHYIGDLHQPLHVGNATDWGGNRITVDWFGKQTNLHALWDYEMLERMDFTYPRSLPILAASPTPPLDSDVLSWINESLSLARSHAYVTAEGRPIKAGDTLGDAYLARNKPVVLQRIVLASRRLAHLLNEIAEGRAPRVFSATSSR